MDPWTPHRSRRIISLPHRRRRGERRGQRRSQPVAGGGERRDDAAEHRERPGQVPRVVRHQGVPERAREAEDADRDEEVRRRHDGEVEPEVALDQDEQKLGRPVESRGLHPDVELEDVRLERHLP